MYVIAIYKDSELLERRAFEGNNLSGATALYNENCDKYYVALKNDAEPFNVKCTIRVCLKVQTDSLKSISFKSH